MLAARHRGVRGGHATAQPNRARGILTTPTGVPRAELWPLASRPFVIGEMALCGGALAAYLGFNSKKNNSWRLRRRVGRSKEGT